MVCQSNPASTVEMIKSREHDFLGCLAWIHGVMRALLFRFIALPKWRCYWRTKLDGFWLWMSWGGEPIVR